MTDLFTQELNVANVGLANFADNIRAAGGGAVQLAWRPPGGGDADAGMRLARLLGDPRIEAANDTALARYLEAQPVLVDVVLAREAIDALDGERRILHAGPPIAWEDMCGPVQGAIAGAIAYEGWAATPQDGAALAASGAIALEPCHHYGAVGPMAGIVSPSMALWVVENAAAGNRAYCNFNEGLGKVLRFGANRPDVLDRLRWMGTELFAVLQAGVRELGGVELRPIMAQALHMGDEVHNRNAAATGLLFKRLVPALLTVDLPAADVRRAIEFIAANDHFFLNLSMAACKAMLDAAHGVERSTMVTVMARNGVNFGIRLSGTGDAWFQAPANPVDGLFFPGYGVDDAAADLGDSAITETAGVGGFAMAAAPAIVQFVGGTPADATENSRRMRSITLGTHPAFTLPALNFGATACGIDARLVLDTGILPIINTGIAHKEAGVGQIGAGITTAPLPCFVAAIDAVAGRRMSPIAIVALGGNALISDAEHEAIPDQYEAVRSVAGPLVELVADGWGLVVSHGNGPQVGFIMRRSELSQGELSPVPMDYAVADTQGAIGYMFLKAIGNALRRKGLDRRVVALVTQTVVDPADPAFAHPSKPVGSFLDDATAHEHAERLGWSVAEDAGRGWRRVVPSPAPVEIVELETIRSLLEAGVIVVAGGGGGIPVVRGDDGDLTGVEAVVDKDSACALLAAELGADLYAIPTGVERVAVNFGQPDQRWIDRLTIDEATALAQSGELGEGSMRPKVEALVTYLERRPGGAGVITSPQMLPAALRRETGTWIES